MNKILCYLMTAGVCLLIFLRQTAISGAEDASEAASMNVPGKALNGATAEGTGIFYAVTENGLYSTADGGVSWESISLPAGVNNVDDIIATKEKLFIAAPSGVYARDGKGEWERVLREGAVKGMDVYYDGNFDDESSETNDIEDEDHVPEKAVFLREYTGPDGEKGIYAGTGGSMYKITPARGNRKKEDGTSFGHTENNVGIKEVQAMAVTYAEVHPDKIKEWRKGARWKAFFPKLNLSFSESLNENIEIYKSATTSYIVEGPQETGADWGIDLTWDLSDIVWNDAQTNIDIRSKLMVQLREDILQEVTRLYFERERAIMEAERYGKAPQDPGTASAGNLPDRALKVRELTAYIDALTGGGFSEKLNSGIKP